MIICRVRLAEVQAADHQARGEDVAAVFSRDDFPRYAVHFQR